MSDSGSTTRRLLNGNSSLVSMKTRCRRATGRRPDGSTQCLTAGPALLVFGCDVYDVLDADAAVPAAGQAAEGEHAVLAQPVDELACDPEDVGCLSGVTSSSVRSTTTRAPWATSSSIARTAISTEVSPPRRSARFFAADRTVGSTGSRVVLNARVAMSPWYP